MFIPRLMSLHRREIGVELGEFLRLAGSGEERPGKPAAGDAVAGKFCAQSPDFLARATRFIEICGAPAGRTKRGGDGN
jgi:hypothetical protein